MFTFFRFKEKYAPPRDKDIKTRLVLSSEKETPILQLPTLPLLATPLLHGGIRGRNPGEFILLDNVLVISGNLSVWIPFFLLFFPKLCVFFIIIISMAFILFCTLILKGQCHEIFCFWFFL
jgi:hypothetical protein